MYLEQPQVEPGSRCACEVGMRAQRKNTKGANVRSSFGSEQPSESGRFLEPSGRVVYERLCGEKLVLLGKEQDCLEHDRLQRATRLKEEGGTLFYCECGRELTPAEDRADERALAIGELLRRSIKAPRSV